MQWCWKEYRTFDLGAIDGPYVLYDGEAPSVYQVRQGALERHPLPPDRSLEVLVDNAGRDRFSVRLADSLSRPETVYEDVDSIFALSDIEGNFNAFYGLPLNNGIIDEHCNWTFGTGHLVLAGDPMDRGERVGIGIHDS